jgi:hypothetical protein
MRPEIVALFESKLSMSADLFSLVGCCCCFARVLLLFCKTQSSKIFLVGLSLSSLLCLDSFPTTLGYITQDVFLTSYILQHTDRATHRGVFTCYQNPEQITEAISIGDDRSECYRRPGAISLNIQRYALYSRKSEIAWYFRLVSYWIYPPHFCLSSLFSIIASFIICMIEGVHASFFEMFHCLVGCQHLPERRILICS